MLDEHSGNRRLLISVPEASGPEACIGLLLSWTPRATVRWKKFPDHYLLSSLSPAASLEPLACQESENQEHLEQDLPGIMCCGYRCDVGPHMRSKIAQANYSISLPSFPPKINTLPSGLRVGVGVLFAVSIVTTS